MASIEMIGVTKQYDRATAIKDLTMKVEDNEFFVLFGPAGAGKTTTLKCIAGIEFPQEGLIKIGGRIVNLIEPSNRNVSMVFENYALFPHMSVYDNIASPLRSRLYRKSEPEIKKAIDKIATLMRIDGLYDRKPSQLSNGQRQRVAIGRCLVREPNVFLMDEPLAHLDAKLKHTMRTELKEMQDAFSTTTIYVTHDYKEAMSLADRIAVLDHGRIVQMGTALQMYYTPSNEFVAKLFGEPEINILEGEYREEDSKALVSTNIGLTYQVEEDVAAALREQESNKLHLGIRGNNVAFTFDGGGDGWLRGTVFANEPIGNIVIMTVQLGDVLLHVVAPNNTHAKLDQTVYVSLNTSNIQYFGADTRQYIIRHNQKELLSIKHSRHLGGEGGEA
ncbi:MAG: ABC transporter ATP-binding protein [Eubacteriales bacterium]|nr:ABC transporter ATP-binding protein [Eubacteriales bacterium]